MTTIFPIVERELRVAARKWTTYWGRALAALAAIGVAIYALAIHELTGGLGGPGGTEAGKVIFWGLSGVGMVLACFCGISHTADTISRERREGTLGLLFLTDLSGLDVGLGKLASSSFGALYGLVAFQPVMAMSLLLGGVTPGEYGRMCLLLGATSIASLGLGLAASSFTENSRTASLLAFAFILLLGGGLPLVGGLADYLFTTWDWVASSDHFFASVLVSCSPATAFQQSGDVEFHLNSAPYRVGLGTTACFGLVGFTTAAVRLPTVWQDKPHRSRRGKLRVLANLGTSHAKWAALLDKSPISWLSERHFARRTVPWLIPCGGITIFGGYYWWSLYQGGNYNLLNDFAYMFTATGTVQTAFKLWVANESGRQLLEDRRSGALELLLSTPLSANQIIKGHLRAVWRMARIPLALVVVADVVAFGYLAEMDRPGDDSNYEYTFTIARHVLFWVDLETLAWVGLDAAMVSRNGQSAQGVIARVLLIPWVGLLTMGMVCTFINRSMTQFDFDLSVKQMGLLITLLCAGNSLVWRTRARRRLTAEFRTRAAVPLDASPLFWLGRLFKRS